MLRTIFTQSFYYANEKDIKYIGAHINLYMKSLNKNKLVTCSFVDYLADFTVVHFFSKNRIIFGANYYGKYINDVGRIVHDKTGGGKCKGMTNLSDCDIASHSFGVNMKIFHFVSIGNVIGNKIDWENKLRWHPCQKPIKLYEWLLMNYAKEGDKILDTHLGSGSIAIACHNLGFNLTACELDKEYFEAAIKRIKQHQAQLRII